MHSQSQCQIGTHSSNHAFRPPPALLKCRPPQQLLRPQAMFSLRQWLHVHRPQMTEAEVDARVLRARRNFKKVVRLYINLIRMRRRWHRIGMYLQGFAPGGDTALTQFRPWDHDFFIDHRLVIPADCVAERIADSVPFSWSRPDASYRRRPDPSPDWDNGHQDAASAATEDGFEFVPDPSAKAKAKAASAMPKPKAKAKAKAAWANHANGPATATSRYWRNVIVRTHTTEINTQAESLRFPPRTTRGSVHMHHQNFPNDWYVITGSG